MPIQILIKRCKKILADHYGAKFQGLVLYGSVVDKKAHKESDIDLLVLLKKPGNYLKELRSLTGLLYPIQLESNQLISAKPADSRLFDKGDIQLYRNAKKYGVLV
jgi:predicted nucleotidyltransferase